jgi:hypothetical protein
MALQAILCETGAGHGDTAPYGLCPQAVNLVRKELLSAPALADDQHIDVRRRDHLRRGEDTPQLR